MSQAQDDDDAADPSLTRKEAIRARKERIVELRQGDKDERRLAKVLAQCRKGNRCGRKECPVCESRKLLAEERVATSIEMYDEDFSGPSDWCSTEVDPKEVKVIGPHRPLDEQKLRALIASISEIGLCTPITIRREGEKEVLVAGLYRLEAARRLGLGLIDCRVMEDREVEERAIDPRQWQIHENLYRAELTVLERAEYVDELRVLIREQAKEGQVAPRGGKQPRETGIKKTAKRLGLTPKEVRRSKEIAAISPEARAEAGALELDDNQEALLEIAKLPTSKAQLAAVRGIAERKRAERARRAAAAVANNEGATAKVQAIDADIAAKEDKIERLNDKLASQRKRKREIENRLVADSVDTVTAVDSPPLAPADDVDASMSTKRDRMAAKADKHPAFAALQAAWENADELQQAWDDAPAEVRARFVVVVLKVHVS
jgi:hypothetical protein